MQYTDILHVSSGVKFLYKEVDIQYTNILHEVRWIKFLYKEVDIQYTDILHEVTGRKRSVLRHMAVGSFDISTFTNRMFVRQLLNKTTRTMILSH